MLMWESATGPELLLAVSNLMNTATRTQSEALIEYNS
jgi:hypothetical protein